MSVATTRTWSM